MEKDDFAQLIETDFRATSVDGQELDLRLVAVRPLPAQPKAPRGQPFSLEFHGPARPILEQRTYAVVHENAGRMDIFIVPLGYAPDGRMRYEAVFN